MTDCAPISTDCASSSTIPFFRTTGYQGRNWRDDFQLTLHIQDDVRVVRDTGNLFLTNIHRVYLGDVREPSLDDEDLRDYFLDPFGPKPVGKTTDGKQVLNDIARITGFAGAPALIQAMFVTWTHDGVQIPKELTAFREYLASL